MVDVHGSKKPSWNTRPPFKDPASYRPKSSSYSRTNWWTKKTLEVEIFPPQTPPNQERGPQRYLYAISYATNFKVQIEHDDIISIYIYIIYIPSQTGRIVYLKAAWRVFWLYFSTTIRVKRFSRRVDPGGSTRPLVVVPPFGLQLNLRS